ncbi:hypothetical protein NCC49_003272 [Naganishia albida]|nr:hypothetical protein NCC49_003272 [Naganishia albida]
MHDSSAAHSTSDGTTACTLSSIEGYAFTDLDFIQGCEVYVQVYTGFTRETAGPSESERAREWTDGTAVKQAWEEVGRQIQSLLTVWLDRPPLFDHMVAYLQPLFRLSCEGEHLQVKELCGKFAELDEIVGRADEFKGEATAYSNPDILRKWTSVRESMQELERILQEVCEYSGLDCLPEGAVLRVVSEERYRNGQFRVCAKSRAKGSLIHFDVD